MWMPVSWEWLEILASGATQIWAHAVKALQIVDTGTFQMEVLYKISAIPRVYTLLAVSRYFSYVVEVNLCQHQQKASIAAKSPPLHQRVRGPMLGFTLGKEVGVDIKWRIF